LYQSVFTVGTPSRWRASIHLDDHDVLAVQQPLADLELEGGETAHVAAHSSPFR
jgi:hypothetical protein